MEEACEASLKWCEEDKYAEEIKSIALRTPIRERENRLELSLGKIISTQIISFKELLFTLRITTANHVYKAVTSLDTSNPALDNYDPFSTRWTVHARKLVALKRIFEASEVLKLQALVYNQVRESMKHENETGLLTPITFPEPVSSFGINENVFSSDLYCNESMEEQEY